MILRNWNWNPIFTLNAEPVVIVFPPDIVSYAYDTFTRAKPCDADVSFKNSQLFILFSQNFLLVASVYPVVQVLHRVESVEFTILQNGSVTT